MIANIDTIIFLGFLLVNIVLGLTSSRGIKTIKEYAIGDRNFSTATIVTTIVATYIGGSTFYTIVSQSYINGLSFIWAVIAGEFVCLFLIAWYFSPRVGEFLGSLSIAEAMGNLFGRRVRIITALAAFIGVAGIIGVQLKVAGLIFEHALGISKIYGILLAGIIITLYATLGGIKSVTFTDVIQFLTFSTVIPVISYFLLTSLDNTSLITDYVASHPLFDFQKTFDYSQSQNLTYLFIFLWLAIPGFNPAYFQRIAMAKNIAQVRKSFMIASVVCLLLVLIFCWIGVLLIAGYPEHVQDRSIVNRLLDIPTVGIKGLLLVGIMAMVMSTIDSYINSSAVIIIHDFLTPLKIKLTDNRLLSTRLASLSLGIVSIFFSLKEGSLHDMVIFANSFWMPVVTMPFIMALLGFRSSEKSVLLGMLSGITAVLVCNYLVKTTIPNSVPVIGMFVNLIVLIGSHYLLGQPGGWVGIKDQKTLNAIRAQRQERFKKIIRNFKEFNIIEVCKNNYPNGEGLICILGFFVMIVTFSSVHNLSIKFHNQYSFLLDVLYPLTLCTSSALISYPLWLQSWKDSGFIAIIWNFIMFFVLICFSFLIALISNFGEIQLIVFMTNIIVIVSLIRWQWALFNITLGVGLVTILYNHYNVNIDILGNDASTSQFKIVYLILLTASSLVLFLKPKQQYQELTEDSNLFLSSKVEDQKQELSRLYELKNEFLRNLEHEAHTPIVGITSMGQVLWENYDKFSEKQRRAATQEIAKSSERLNSLVGNLIDLSKLESLNYKLNKTQVSLTDLVHERVEICHKLYVEEKDQENLNFDLKIEDKLTVLCDENYIGRTIDNIVINAIQYCKNGTISITLKSIDNHTVEFSVGDEGIGIPKDELLDIFDPFTVSSRTKSRAGGRGIGLTLCKKAIAAHGGTITASNKDKGSLFRVILPK
jgi:Na+/proline symporter/signal transduction histidine kinase